jgi:hypothetical protein
MNTAQTTSEAKQQDHAPPPWVIAWAKGPDYGPSLAICERGALDATRGPVIALISPI